MNKAVRVSEAQVRILFEEERILERVLASQLRERVETSKPAPPTKVYLPGHPGPTGEPFPAGTMSQLIGYYGPEGKVAEAHRYLCPDGSLAASGMPDPKMVLKDDTWYVYVG